MVVVLNCLWHDGCNVMRVASVMTAVRTNQKLWIPLFMFYIYLIRSPEHYLRATSLGEFSEGVGYAGGDVPQDVPSLDMWKHHMFFLNVDDPDFKVDGLALPEADKVLRTNPYNSLYDVDRCAEITDVDECVDPCGILEWPESRSCYNTHLFRIDPASIPGAPTLVARKNRIPAAEMRENVEFSRRREHNRVLSKRRAERNRLYDMCGCADREESTCDAPCSVGVAGDCYNTLLTGPEVARVVGWKRGLGSESESESESETKERGGVRGKRRRAISFD
jgi:hypothetical protein